MLALKSYGFSIKNITVLYYLDCLFIDILLINNPAINSWGGIQFLINLKLLVEFL
jgi:hypothetical protein